MTMGITLEPMCRNIRPLHNFEPPATRDEVAAAALQYVRKISGYTKPSQANQEAFDRAIDEVAHASFDLLHSLEVEATPKRRGTSSARWRPRRRRRTARSRQPRRAPARRRATPPEPRSLTPRGLPHG